MAIYARLENGTYAEVTGVYKTDGTEITEIFQGDRLVYSATNEIYGTVPLYYDGLGYELIDYVVYGNAVQDGTPSADAPVDVIGCGVRTGNLFDKDNATVYSLFPGAENTISVSSNTRSIAIPCIGGETYTVSKKAGKRFKACFTAKPIATQVTYTNLTTNNTAEAITVVAPLDAKYLFVYFYHSTADVDTVETLVNSIMINTGSTALPYEPYGFKLPLTVNGTEYPIYLGTVPTTRRVKKLVLTGDENWRFYSDASGTWQFYFDNIQLGGVAQSSCVSNIAQYGVTTTTRHGYEYGCYLVTAGSGVGFQMRGAKDAFTDVGTWKSYLAAQYAAGTPVTVWYVLAEPETGIVNEPLMKISDYADTVSFAQSQVAIPTVYGANVLDMTSPVKPSEVYVKGKGIKQNRGQS